MVRGEEAAAERAVSCALGKENRGREFQMRWTETSSQCLGDADSSAPCLDLNIPAQSRESIPREVPARAEIPFSVCSSLCFVCAQALRWTGAGAAGRAGPRARLGRRGAAGTAPTLPRGTVGSPVLGKTSRAEPAESLGWVL